MKLQLNTQYNLMLPSDAPKLFKLDYFKKTFNGWKKAWNIIEPYLNGYTTCVQAGSCFGIYPKLISQNADFEEILTFEPYPILHQCTIENTMDCDNVKAYQLALGSQSGYGQFHLNGYGGASLIETWKGKKSTKVKIKSIDTLDVKKLDLLWLDVELAENDVILGAKETIKRDKPVIVAESRKDYRPELIATLKDLGYEQKTEFSKCDILFLPT